MFLSEQIVVIIPAKNEATRIGSVLEPIISSKLFSEIIVIDDCSNDQTANIAGQFGVKVISHDKNQGKSVALQTGVVNSISPILCFLDADLVGVTPELLGNLVTPVSTRKKSTTLAVFSRGRLSTTLAQQLFPLISGQRCFRRELLDDFKNWGNNFEIEVHLEHHFKDLGIPRTIIDWPGVSQVTKEEKMGFCKGIMMRLAMFWNIVYAQFFSRYYKPKN